MLIEYFMISCPKPTSITPRSFRSESVQALQWPFVAWAKGSQMRHFQQLIEVLVATLVARTVTFPLTWCITAGKINLIKSGKAP